MTKICSDCGIEKPYSEYHKDKRRPLGIRDKCKKCRKKDTKAYYDLTKGKHYIKNKYNITVEEYERCMSTSDCCEVCGSKENLCYDHCHITMKFRGVLCRGCNSAIGLLGDTKEDLHKAFVYLNKGNQ